MARKGHEKLRLKKISWTSRKMLSRILIAKDFQEMIKEVAKNPKLKEHLYSVKVIHNSAIDVYREVIL